MALVAVPLGDPPPVSAPVRRAGAAAPAAARPGARSVLGAPATPAPGPVTGPLRGDWLALHPPPDLGVHAASAVLLDLDTDELLWARDEHAARPPASLTKLVTAMVAMDLAGSLDREVIVPPEATRVEPDSTVMGLTAGEALTVRDLMYGVFLVSGNDAAETLASGLVGRARFLQLMDEKAAGLGMTDSHFSNPTGLDDPGLRSSAYDLAVATVAVVTRYPELLPIAATKDVVLPATAAHPEFDLHSLIKLVATYPGATGLKTGYTDDAGYCLVGTAVRADRHLAVVLMGDDTQLTVDASRLLDFGFGSPPAEPLAPGVSAAL